MKTKIGLTLMVFGLLFTTACSKYPPASDRLLEDLVVMTQYDTKVDFNNYHTFSMPDAIIMISSSDTTFLTDATAQSILTQISTNMENRGFMKAAAKEKADFGLQVFYFQNTYIYTYYYDWWGYYPYWYYYYPYYPVYYSSYTTGALNFDLVDQKYVNSTNETLSVRWNAYIRGLLTGSHTLSEINGRIDQAFIQTPQLKTTAN